MFGLKRPFALAGLTVLFVLVFLLSTGLSFAVYAFAAVSLVLCAVTGFKRKRVFIRFAICAVAAAAAALSYEYAVSVRTGPALSLAGTEAVITGEASDYAKETQSSFGVTLGDITVNGVKTGAKITVYSSELGGVKPGDTVSFFTREIMAKDTSGIYKWHTLSSGCFLYAFPSGQTEISAADRLRPKYYPAFLRSKTEEKVKDFCGAEEAGVILALLTGERDYISDTVLQSIRLSGISHIFAVSGMHLALWTGLIGLLSGLITKKRRPRAVFSIIFVIFYSAFTGFSPSVLRSAVMILFTLSGVIINRRPDPFNSLGAAAAFLLTLNPYLAGNVSFLLSFASVLALCALMPSLMPQRERKKRGRVKKRILKIGSAITVSAGVILTSLPLTSLFFGYVSLASPVTGLLCAPVAEGVMTLSAAAVLLPVRPLSGLLFTAAGFLSGVMTSAAGRIAKLDFLLCGLEPRFLIPFYLVCVCVCVTVFYVTKKNKEALKTAVLSFSALLICCAIVFSVINRKTVRVCVNCGVNATNIVLTASDGSFSAVFGLGGDYGEYSDALSFLYSGCSAEPRYLFIPREKETENANYRRFASVFPGAETVCGSFEKNALTPSITAECTSDAALIRINNTSVAISMRPSQDFSALPEEYRRADILIARAALPAGADSCSFEKTIILSDRITSESDGLTPRNDIIITVKEKGYDIR